MIGTLSLSAETTGRAGLKALTPRVDLFNVPPSSVQKVVILGPKTLRKPLSDIFQTLTTPDRRARKRSLCLTEICIFRTRAFQNARLSGYRS
jgi:hypothetical protein